MPWTQQNIKFLNRGLDLMRTIDQVEQHFYTRLTNTETHREGQLQSRAGLTEINDTPTGAAIHSVSRLDDPETATNTRIIGSGTTVKRESTPGTFVAISAEDSGWSGDPIGLTIWRPRLEDANWVYISDSKKTVRVNVAGTAHLVGITPPSVQSSVYAHIPAPAISDGTALAIYTYNDATAWEISGWTASSDPTETINAKKSSRSAAPGSTDVIRGDTPAAGKQTAVIGRIIANDLDKGYDARAIIEGYLRVSNPAHFDEVRLEFSIEPLTAIASSTNASPIAVTTSAAHGYQTGDSVTIDGHLVNTAANGNWTITVTSATVFTLDTSTGNGVGAATGNVLNFSKARYIAHIGISSDTEVVEGTKPEDDEEKTETHITFQPPPPAENFDPYDDLGRFGDFTEGLNEDPPPAATSTTTVGQEHKPDNTDNPNSETSDDTVATGHGQWSPFSFQKQEFRRVGTDRTLGWADTGGARITALMNADTTADDFIEFTEIDIMPSESELTTEKGAAYEWRYTYYDSAAGVESAPSAPMAEGVIVDRQTVTLTLNESAQANVDRIRVYRRGGQLLQFHREGEIENVVGGGTTSFISNKSDLAIANNPGINFAASRPIPISSDFQNLLTRSEEFNHADWVKANITVEENSEEDPTGGSAADLLASSGVGDATIKQAVTSAATATRYFSVYLRAKKITGSGPHASITIDDFSSETNITLKQYQSDLNLWERFVLAVPAVDVDPTVGIKVLNTAINIVSSTNASPIVVTVASHDYQTGDTVTIANHLVNTNANGTWTVTRVDGTQFSLDTSTGNGVGAATGTARSHDEIAAFGAQLEDHSATTAAQVRFPSRYAPTVDVAVTDYDNLIYAPPGDMWVYQGRYMMGIRPYKDDSIYKPNFVFWSDPFDPDTWPPDHNLEVSPSGEELQRGFEYNGRSYIFSKDSLYVVVPDVVGLTTFSAHKTPVSVGLWSRYALAVGNMIWWLGRDGIYASNGGREENLTDNSFVRPLFRDEAANGYEAVDYDAALTDLRLEYKDPYLYFTYAGADTGGHFVLRYHVPTQRWDMHDFSVDPTVVTKEANTRNLLVGDTSGTLYTWSGTTDDNTAVTTTVRTGSLDQGAADFEKLYGDLIVEANIPSGDAVEVTAYLDDEEIGVPFGTVIGTGVRQRYILALNNGEGLKARSIALGFVWDNAQAQNIESSTNATPIVITITNHGYETGDSVTIAGHLVNTNADGTWTITKVDENTFSLDTSVGNGVGGATGTASVFSAGAVLHEASLSYEVQARVTTQLAFTDWDDLQVPFDKYVWGASVELETLDGTPKELHIQGDGTTQLVKTIEPTAGKQTVQLSWQPFRATQLRAIPSDGECIIHTINWYHAKEAPQLSTWASQWETPAEGSDVYCWGIEIEGDTGGHDKVLSFQQDGGAHIVKKSASFDGRNTQRITWNPVKASTLRFFSVDDTPGYLYRWNWITDGSQIEPPLLDYFDSNWQPAPPAMDYFCWGIEIELQGTATIEAFSDREDEPFSKQTTTTDRRRKMRLSWPTVKASELRFTAAGSSRIYRWNWLTTEEPPKLAHWDTNWENPAPGQDVYVRGIELDLDTQGQNKPFVFTKDGGQEMQEMTANTDGRQVVRLTWTPTRATTVRGRSFFTDACIYSWRWIAEPEPAAIAAWDSNYQNDGSLDDKWISGLYLEHDAAGKRVIVEVDGKEVLDTIVSVTKRGISKLSFGPVRGVNMRFYSDDPHAARLYDWNWKWEAEPAELSNFATNWDSLGWPYEKRIKGVSIEADTHAETKVMALRIDGVEEDIDTFVVRADGRNKTMYAFDNVLARTVRLAATDDVVGRSYDITWLWDKEPIAVRLWQTQETSFGQNGYLHLRDAYITLDAPKAVTLTLTIDGTAQSEITIAATTGREKTRVELPAVKGKLFKFKFESDDDFKIYVDDSEVRVAQWHSQLGYSPAPLPFLGR